MAEPVSLIDKYTEEGQILKTLDDYDRNKHQKLFRRMADRLAGSRNSIEGFNNWVLNLLPEQFMAESFTAPDGVEVIFSDIHLEKPMYVINGEMVPLYPSYARKYKIPYKGRLNGVCTTKKEGVKNKTNIFFGEVPIMLGSIKCNLYNKTPEELLKLGECVSDPFGYFIINSERSVITHDKLRSNYPLITTRKSENIPEVKETYNTKYRQILTLSKKINAIKVLDDKSGRNEPKHIPIFIVFKVLANLEPEEVIENYLFRFIKEEDREIVYYSLAESITKYRKHPDVYLYLFKKRTKLYKEKYSDNLSKQEIKKMVTDDLIDSIYSNYNKEGNRKARIEAKVLSLTFLLSKMVLFMINRIELDHKDHWKIKRFENAPVLVSALVLAIFKEALKITCFKKNKDSKLGDYTVFGELLNSKCSSEFKKNIDKSFSTASWGVSHTGWITQNYAEATKRDTPLALWSLSVKNTNNTPTDGQIVELRFLQPSQRNRHCIAETPEGKQVGIVKYNCLTGLFSIESSAKEIVKLAEKHCGLYSEGYPILVILNGEVIYCKEKEGFLYGNSDFKEILCQAKREAKIPIDSEIVFNRDQNVYQIFTDSSRPICPYLIVNSKTDRLVIDEMNGWDLDFDTLITNGCMEYLSAAEEDNEAVTICKSVDHFYETRDKDSEIFTYSHCCVDPLQIYSISTSTCPFSNHQPSPRTTYQAAMGKQAVGYYNLNYHLRFPKEFKRLFKSERSITETDTYFIPKMDLMPSGQIANIAIMANNDNQEDAVVVCEDFIKSGNLTLIKYKTFEMVVNTSSKSGGVSHFRKPELRPREDPRLYRHLNEDGFPKLDSYIEVGDYIIGRTVETPNGIRNESIKAELDMEGYVDKIEIVPENQGRSPLIRIRLRNKRPYIAGDKLALRYAQKGTVGKILKREEMPVVTSGPNRGIVPDILFNPIGFPKRQTVGLLLEGLVSKAALYHGERVDVSAFRKLEVEKAKQTLRDYGLDENGLEEMSTSSGKMLKDKIFFVPLYEQALRHHVLDKIQFRTTGNRDYKTHQPQGGRARGSGLKVGEMEKDAFAAHGVSNILLERMMKSSDEFKLLVCHNCGSIIDSKVCRICDNSQPGILLIPYVFKVFIHLLNGINMDIRLKTKKCK